MSIHWAQQSPHYSLGSKSGFLTGAYNSADDFEDNDFRKHNPRFQGEAWKEVRFLVVNLTLAQALIARQ